jgi:hypothetical protein
VLQLFATFVLPTNDTTKYPAKQYPLHNLQLRIDVLMGSFDGYGQDCKNNTLCK